MKPLDKPGINLATPERHAHPHPRTHFRLHPLRDRVCEYGLQRQGKQNIYEHRHTFSFRKGNKPPAVHQGSTQQVRPSADCA